MRIHGYGVGPVVAIVGNATTETRSFIQWPSSHGSRASFDDSPRNSRFSVRLYQRFAHLVQGNSRIDLRPVAKLTDRHAIRIATPSQQSAFR
jgi:hypothetical protein